MASKTLSKDQKNFIWIAIACVDFIKVPLKDIFASKIKPADLYKKIDSPETNVKSYLSEEQLKICFIPPPGEPDYNDFDVTLLYSLIRNLCNSFKSLRPTEGWGKVPNSSHTKIGDDVERLRLMRNKFAHANSAGIPDTKFECMWDDLKSVIERIQTFVNFVGCNVNYKQNLADIEKNDFGVEDLKKYKLFLEAILNLLKQEEIKVADEPQLSIKGANEVVCGEKTCFEADFKQEVAPHWSISWQRIKGRETNHIDISQEKYRESSRAQLVIHSVGKKDQGEYQVVLTRESNGGKRKIESNAIFLRVVGEPPEFKDWKVTTEGEGTCIKIHYKIKKSTPNVISIKWTKNGEGMDLKNRRYVGGGLSDSCLTITSPSEVDKGTYSCTVINSVGSTSKDVKLDIPSAEISINSTVYFGFISKIGSSVSSTPPPNKAEWQKSVDGAVFHSIDINKPEYNGSCPNPKYPSLVIQSPTFEDMLYYRLLMWNGLGECVSNTIFLDVKGHPPNIMISHETCFQSRSVKLIAKIFPYDECHATQDVFWTVNGEKKIDKQGLGGKYSLVSVDDPSLTIHKVNSHDAGSYKLTATNVVGSTTSDAIDLNIPAVLMTNSDKKEDGSQWFTLTIKSIPEPFLVQWSRKKKNDDKVQLINVHAEEFKGSSCSLDHPVLVVKQREQLEKYDFQIEVKSFIGTFKKTLQDFLESMDLTTLAHGVKDLDTSLEKENKVSLSDCYEDEGAGIRFATLFEDLVNKFPEEKFEKLKDIIQNSKKVKNNNEYLNDAKSARDCFRILVKENLFSESDVTFVQFLLRKTECIDLENKCIEFAKRQRALGFYEIPSEDGLKSVAFHVLGELSDFNQEQRTKIRKTVASIVGCDADRVLLNGYRRSNSFIALLSLEVIYMKKLLAIQKQDRCRFEDLNVDYLTVDFITVYLSLSKESKRVVYRVNTGTKEDMSPLQQSSSGQKLKSHEYIHKVKEKRLYEPNTKLSTSMHNQPKATLTASINASMKFINQISCLGSDCLWISSPRNINEIDENGNLLRQLDVDWTHAGFHTMSKDGDLLFKKENSIHMLTKNGEVRNLHINVHSKSCIYSSRINSDIFVSDYWGVKRYNKEGCSLQTFDVLRLSSEPYRRFLTGYKTHEYKSGKQIYRKRYDKEWGDPEYKSGKQIYRKRYDKEWGDPEYKSGKQIYRKRYDKEWGDLEYKSGILIYGEKYDKEWRDLIWDMQVNITENINGDIILTNNLYNEVVAVNRDGHPRFTYRYSRNYFDVDRLFDDTDPFRYRWYHVREKVLDPIGICVDLSGHILVGKRSYPDSGVHLLDEYGQVLSKLLTDQSLNFSALCVDDKNNLYIADDGRINVYTYLSGTTTEEHDNLLIKSESKPKAIPV